MVVLVTMVWLEHLVTVYQDLLGNNVRSILTNACQDHATMEVAAWIRTIVFIVCVLQEQEEAFANRVCNTEHALLHYSPIYLHSFGLTLVCVVFLASCVNWGFIVSQSCSPGSTSASSTKTITSSFQFHLLYRARNGVTALKLTALTIFI